MLPDYLVLLKVLLDGEEHTEIELSRAIDCREDIDSVMQHIVNSHNFEIDKLERDEVMMYRLPLNQRVSEARARKMFGAPPKKTRPVKRFKPELE
jgi:hypothetical protein